MELFVWAVVGIPGGIIAGRMLFGSSMPFETRDVIAYGILGAVGGPISWVMVVLWGLCYLMDKDLR